MNTFRRIFHLSARTAAGTRFDRYYSGILRSGAGYPTADEARKDLRNYDVTMSSYGWPR